MSEPIKTVLIVDDEILIRQSFVDYFEDRLWRALQAESGEQALELLEEESPHAAVVDIRMRGMDGNAFIRKAYQRNSKIAFVICTGSPEYCVPPDLLELNCVSGQLLKKPVRTMADLENAILRTMEHMREKESEDE